MALEAIRGDLPLTKLAAERGIHHTMIAAGKGQAIERTSVTFSGAGHAARSASDVEVRISMDGQGRWMDNVFIERLWRSLKSECVYLPAIETASELRAGFGRWISYHNHHRPHSGLAGRTPKEAYRRAAFQITGGMLPII